MINAPIPEDDYFRLQSLYDLEILNTTEDPKFNEIAELAASICNTPMAAVSLVDTSRQWLKARVGLNMKETPRDISFCGHAIAGANNFFQVEDALKDERFIDNPLVIAEPYIRFYAGWQLMSSQGFRIGMLCVMDTKPGALTSKQIFALKVLAHSVSMLMDMRVMHNVVREVFLDKVLGK